MPDPVPAPNPNPSSLSPPDGFYSSATSMARTPLGFLGLCLVLVYAIAGLVFAVGRNIEKDTAAPLVWFIILYPVLVLVVFVVLVIFYRENIASDEYRHLRELIARNRERLEMMAEVADVAFDWPRDDEPITASASPLREARSDDPQKGKWGEKRAANGYEVVAGKITPLKTNPNYFRIPLEVRRTDGTPLTGTVVFHLHDSFTPDVEDVEAANGVARLEAVAYGAFTVGVELPDGTKLEIDLSDPDIDAPEQFKRN